jgi:hypothetical protein
LSSARAIAAISLSVLIASAGNPFASYGQQVPDTAAESESPHSPRGALWRALAAPGWGQIYNGQYIKLPFLYGAIGGLAYLAGNINNDYLLYRRAYLYKSFQELVDSGRLAENPNESLKPYYDELAAKFGAISSEPLRGQRDKLRRNRDLSFVGIGLVYGLSILDAFISAQLLDFDVDEDLTLHVRPAPGGLSASMSMRF